MNKKIIILVGFIVFLCGCSSEVNVTISEDTIDEEISINHYVNEELTKEMVKNSFRNYIPINKDEFIPDADDDEKIDGVTYYNRTLTDIGSGYNAKYQYNFKYGDYHNARSINNAFRSFNLYKDTEENTLGVSTDGNGIVLFDNYPELESVKINLKSDLEVKEANVEPVNGVYSWTFTKDDNNKNIYIVYKLPEKEDKKSENNSENKVIINNDPKSDNAFIIFINKHPILTALVVIIIFLVGVKIITKLSRF